MNWIKSLHRRHGFQPPYVPADVKKKVKRPCISFYPYDELDGKNVRKRVYLPSSVENPEHWFDEMMENVEDRLKAGYYIPAVKDGSYFLSAHNENPDMLVDDAITAYLDYKTPLVNSPRDFRSIFDKTIRNYIQKFWPQMKLNEFSKSHVARFLNDMQQERGWSPKTRNNHRHSLYNFFNYFIELEVLENNPAGSVSLQKNRNVNHYMPFMDEQVQELQEYFKKNNPLLHQLTRFVYYTFARPWKELRNSRVMNLDMQNQLLFIPSVDSKNSKGDYVYLPEKLCEIIEHYGIDKAPPSSFIFSADGKPGYEQIVPHSVRYQHQKILDKFGLGKTHHMYSWKPTGICAMYRTCKDIKAVQRQCRHSDINMTDRYLSKLGLYKDLFKVDFE